MTSGRYRRGIAGIILGFGLVAIHEQARSQPWSRPSGHGSLRKSVAADGCPQVEPEQDVSPSTELRLVDMAKEPASAIGWVVDEAVEGIARCPNDEAAWYELVRGIEMKEELSSGRYEPAVVIGGRKLESLAEVTTEAVRRVPSSPRVALVDARARPEPGRVADLVARFPSFAPLRLALARAQLAAGNPEAAEETLMLFAGLKGLPGRTETLAAIKLARGDPSKALEVLADKPEVLSSSKTAGSEAYWSTGGIERERYETRYKAQLALHRPGAAVRPLLDAAEHRSKAARALLENPGPQLLEAIAAARRAGKLNAVDREYLKHREAGDRMHVQPKDHDEMMGRGNLEKGPP